MLSNLQLIIVILAMIIILTTFICIGIIVYQDIKSTIKGNDR